MSDGSRIADLAAGDQRPHDYHAPWSTVSMRRWVTTHPTTTTTRIPVSVVASEAGSGACSGAGEGADCAHPAAAAAGIGIGIASVDAGGIVALKWLLGALYANKADLKQLRAAARQAGITDEQDIKEFGDWVEWYKRKGRAGRQRPLPVQGTERMGEGMVGALQVAT